MFGTVAAWQECADTLRPRRRRPAAALRRRLHEGDHHLRPLLQHGAARRAAGWCPTCSWSDESTPDCRGTTCDWQVFHGVFPSPLWASETFTFPKRPYWTQGVGVSSAELGLKLETGEATRYLSMAERTEERNAGRRPVCVPICIGWPWLAGKRRAADAPQKKRPAVEKYGCGGGRCLACGGFVTLSAEGQDSRCGVCAARRALGRSASVSSEDSNNSAIRQWAAAARPPAASAVAATTCAAPGKVLRLFPQHSSLRETGPVTSILVGALNASGAPSPSAPALPAQPAWAPQHNPHVQSTPLLITGSPAGPTNGGDTPRTRVRIFSSPPPKRAPPAPSVSARSNASLASPRDTGGAGEPRLPQHPVAPTLLQARRSTTPRFASDAPHSPNGKSCESTPKTFAESSQDFSVSASVLFEYDSTPPPLDVRGCVSSIGSVHHPCRHSLSKAVGQVVGKDSDVAPFLGMLVQLSEEGQACLMNKLIAGNDVGSIVSIDASSVTALCRRECIVRNTSTSQYLSYLPIYLPI
jgi:hypothetical protein